MDQVDVAIVGAGPTGLFAAYYAGFRGLSTVVIDALPEPGGQVSAMYPEKLIYDVAGFPVIRGRDLVANLVEQASTYHPRYLLGVQAGPLSYVDGKPAVALSDGTSVHCGAVIVTGGLGSFTARRLPAADSFPGAGVVYFVPRLDDLAGHNVIVVGGGDSAFDWALSLQPVAKSVTLVHRRDKFRAHAGTIARVRELPVDILVNTEVNRLLGDEVVTGVEVQERGEEPRELPADTVVAALGFTADLGPLAAQQVTRGDPGRHEEAVGAGDELVGVQYPVEVVPGRQRLLPLGGVPRPQLRLDGAAQALERGGGHDALRGTADAHQHIGAGALPGGRDRPGDVAVGDEPDPRARGAYLADQLLVPRPVEDADRDVGDAGMLDLRDAPQLLGDPRVDLDDVGALRADGQLLHVEHRARVEHRAPLGDREHRQRIRHALPHQRRAVDRVDRHVDLGTGTVADVLAVVQHRGVV